MTVKDKDFTETDAAKDAAQGTAEEATQRKPRKEYTDEEATKYANKMNTSGRKGLRMQRINLAVTPDTKDYVKTMCRLLGMNYTEFINGIIEKHKREYGELYLEALKARKNLL